MTVIRKHVGTGALTRPAVLGTAIQRLHQKNVSTTSMTV
jgi:hypothetical protein